MAGCAVGVKLPPWGVILMHLGACSEAITWASKRSVSAATLAACPEREWRVWFAKKLGVTTKATWESHVAAIWKALSGDGDGDGDGSGSGSGSGDGYGYG